MVLSHRETACETWVAVHVRVRDLRCFRLVVDRVVAGMNCERESGVKGSAYSLKGPLWAAPRHVGSCTNERLEKMALAGKVRHERGRRSSDLLYQ